jgi:apolipoprotein N-acyltransferase
MKHICHTDHYLKDSYILLFVISLVELVALIDLVANKKKVLARMSEVYFWIYFTFRVSWLFSTNVNGYF